MDRAELQPDVVFCAAIDLASPAERAAYLDQVCGDNPDLRRRVERLLEAHTQAGNFLASRPSVAPATTDLPAECAGTEVGPYKLLEQIGEGGFGVVFMAEQQQPIRRKVALKVLKAGMDTRQVIARFEAERQALALMDHPNIAKVLEGGQTTSGRPYFVMDLVKGLPITEFCDQNQLTPRERLELFVYVCRAVQHAHQKGIIHRDLKPTNVLVTLHDGTPLVKVIDFGIAKALGQQLTNKTLFTGFAQMIGTPLYMSPEQATLSNVDVDTRSDIYSLGVLLYELLTGTTPFDKERFKEAGFDEIRRIIREEEPPKPSTRVSTMGQAATTVSMQRRSDPKRLSRMFRGELDWIVMKALEKDRNRRYETASAFAADVQRYLYDEPVLACPPSAWYRLAKFTRRNRTPLAIAGLILVFVVLLGSGAGWIAWDRAARLALTEREVSLALDEATVLQSQAKWPEALEAIKRAQGVLAGSDSEELHARARKLRTDLEMVMRLEEIRLPRAVAGEEGSFDNAAADAAYARAFREYGIDVDALAPTEAAERIRTRTILVELTVALDNWAKVRKESRRADEPSWKRLSAVVRAADRDAWRNQVRDALDCHQPETLIKLAVSAPIAKLPVQTLSLLGGALDSEHGQTLLRQAQRRFPNDFWMNFQLAWSLDFAPPPHQQLDEAIRFYTAALAIRPGNIPTHFFLAAALHHRGNLDEAAAMYRQIGELIPNDGVAHYNLGTMLDAQHQREEAMAEYRKAIELKPDLAWAHHNLGTLLAEVPSRLDEASVELRTAIKLKPELTEAYSNLSVVLRRQGKLDDAIAACQDALRVNHDAAGAHCNLGLAFRDKGEFVAALRHLRRGDELMQRTSGWSPRSPSAQWLRQAERLAALDAKLPKVLQGGVKPADATEGVALARICQKYKKWYAAAARLYVAAFAAEPKLADDLRTQDRYNGACAAALASCTQGEDASTLKDKERALLRRQALDWLRADLTAWDRLLQKEPDQARAALYRTLRHWQQDTDFAGMRGDNLAKLPEVERQPWQRLWADVDQALRKVNHSDTKDPRK